MARRRDGFVRRLGERRRPRTWTPAERLAIALQATVLLAWLVVSPVNWLMAVAAFWLLGIVAWFLPRKELPQ